MAVVAPLIAASVIGAIVTIAAHRPDDTALLHSARNASDWGHHVIRIQRAEAVEEAGLATLLTNPRFFWEWFLEGDHDFPPLLHATASILGTALGHDSMSVQRAGLWWLVLLCLATGWVAWNIQGARSASPPHPAGPSRLTIACAAAAATALIPAHHAAALNYYYDLPMTALLWATAAIVLALGARPPVLPGLVAGAGVFVAGLMKWTALPAAAPLLLGVLATPPQRRDSSSSQAFPWRERILTGVLSGATAVALLLVYWRQSPRSWNRMLSMTYDTTLDPNSDFPATSWLTTVSDTLGRGIDAVTLGSNISLEALVWYPLRFAFSYASPLVCAALVLLAMLWLWNGARGWVLVVVTTVVHFALLLAVFTSQDERFLLTLGPLAALVGALGWANLPGGLRQTVALALVALGLWVGWDFHHSEPPEDVGLGKPASAEPTSTLGRIWAEIDYDRRGLGLQTGVDSQWGWVRADSESPSYFPNRELLWKTSVTCGASVILAQEDLTTDLYGDGMWWTYRLGLARTQRSPGVETVLGFEGNDVHPLDGTWIEFDQAVATDKVVAIARGDGSVAPEGPLASGWEVRAILDREATEGTSHLSLWTPAGSQLCGQWPERPFVLHAEALSEPSR